MVLQTNIEAAFALLFGCSEEEMEKQLLGRNQVRPLNLQFMSKHGSITIFMPKQFSSFCYG